MLKNLSKILIFAVLLGIIVFIWQIKPNNQAEKISDEELKQRIGQMLLIGFRGTEISKNSSIVKTIKDLNIGSVILFDFDVPSQSFPRNIISPEQTKNLIKDLQKFSPTPLFIAIDEEGNQMVNRLKPKYGFIPISSPIKDRVKQLADLGFNLNLAPVVDIGTNRSFSDEPAQVVSQALNFIEEHHQQNIITCLKHFPGLGSSSQDTHKGLADITNTYQEQELIPFQEIIKQGKADIIMTAHIINKNIDPQHPASLSPLFIQNILRQQLKFNGLIMTDDLQMGAITKHYNFAESIIQAINAGADIIIISNNNNIYDESAPYQASQIIFEATKNGQIPIAKIMESSDRLSTLKSSFSLVWLR